MEGFRRKAEDESDQKNKEATVRSAEALFETYMKTAQAASLKGSVFNGATNGRRSWGGAGS